jgi:hypothetical protein
MAFDRHFRHVAIDATANVHPINPLIYGVAFASKTDLIRR